MFYCLTASGMHGVRGSSSGMTALAAALATLFLASSIALWVLADARQQRRPAPYDLSSFVFFAWPVLAPIYLFSTRGWRGFAPLGWFLLLYVAAAITSVIPSLLTPGE